jgi:hypothetical protein
MFHVDGDTILYDGKPFAVITAGLSGFRMEAVDAINHYESFLEQHISDRIDEERADDTKCVLEVVERAETEAWFPGPFVEWLERELRAVLKSKE